MREQARKKEQKETTKQEREDPKTSSSTSETSHNKDPLHSTPRHSSQSQSQSQINALKSRMTSTTDDPNGWVKSPPSTFVKIHNTSRETMNGQFGLVLTYSSSNSRYTVLLVASQSQSSTTSQVALKSDNLQIVTMIEKVQAYYQLFRNNPELQNQLNSIQQMIQTTTGMTSLVPIGIGLFVVLSLGWYFLGFSKLILLLSILLILGIVIGPDIIAGIRDPSIIRRNSSERWKSMIEQQIPYGGYGTKIVTTPLYLNIFTSLLIGFAFYSLFASSGSGRAPVTTSTTTTGVSPPFSESLLKQQYYKLGFDDATNAKEFGTSLDTTTTRSATEDPMMDHNNIYDSPPIDYSSYTPSLPPKKSSSPFNFSTMFSILTIGQTLFPIVQQAGGLNPPSSFQPQVFLAGIQSLDTWKLGILGFSVYRLLSTFFF